MTAVTQWFPFALPEHPGLYQRLNTTTGLIYFSVFDGCWFAGSLFAEGAEEAAKQHHISVRQLDPAFPWRGLAEP